MSEDNYQIRREEWDEMRSTLSRIDRTLLQFLEREKAIDGGIKVAQETANQALARSIDNSERLTRLESNSTHNSKQIDDWQGLAYKIVGGVCVAGVCGTIGYVIAGGVT